MFIKYFSASEKIVFKFLNFTQKIKIRFALFSSCLLSVRKTDVNYGTKKILMRSFFFLTSVEFVLYYWFLLRILLSCLRKLLWEDFKLEYRCLRIEFYKMTISELSFQNSTISIVLKGVYFTKSIIIIVIHNNNDK